MLVKLLFQEVEETKSLYSIYSSNVLKKYQVQMGMPYQVRQQQAAPPADNTEKVEAVENLPTKEDIIETARKEAEKIINAAKLQADLILSSAHDEVAARVSEAEQQAKEEGYEYGESLAREHYQSLISEAEELKQKAKELYDNTFLCLETDIVEIILQVARKVIGTELVQNQDVVLGLVRTAISAASSSDKISICVCADDYDYVIENKDKVLEGFKGIRDYEIVKDNSLKKGECLVNTGFGTVDSSIETQLQAVEHTLRELLGQFNEEEPSFTTE